MANTRALFEEALAITDPVARSAALCDLALDAEQLMHQGRRAEAIELFELLTTLDRHDDLLYPAIESADEHLVELGVRTLPTMEEMVQGLNQQFAHLDEYSRLFAVAKSLIRAHQRRDDAWRTAQKLLDSAEQIRPINEKDKRFRAEILQRVASMD